MPTAQAGKNIFISDGTGTGAIALVALRSVTATIDGKPVDVTSRDSAGFQQLLAAAGIAKLLVKGDGVLTDSTQHTVLRGRALAQSIDQYTLTDGNGDTLTAVGGFQLTQFETKGQYNNEQLYTLTLESSGSITATNT